MARDLSVVRARPSRVRRSGGPGIDAGEPSQKLRPSTPHNVPHTNALASFAQGLVPGLQQAIQQFGETSLEEDKSAIRLENIKVLAQFNREVVDNKAGVEEAIRTGDYSALSFDASKYINRDVIRIGVHQMVGQATAYEDMEGLQEQLRQIDDPMRLNDALSKFVSESTKDVQSDFYANAYSETLMAMGRKMVGERFKEIGDAGRRVTQQTIRNNIENDFRNVGITWTMDGLNSGVLDIVPQLVAGGWSPEAAALLAPEMMDKSLLSNIGKRPDLVPLLDAPDPTREGTTLRERMPGQAEAAIARAVTEHTSELSMVARESLRAVDRGIATYGTPAQTMTPEEMWSDLKATQQTFYGEGEVPSARFQKTEAALASFTKSLFKDEVNIQMFKDGFMGGMNDAEYNEAADVAFLSMGTMSAEEQSNTLSIFAEHGIEGPLRQRMERMLRGTPEQHAEAMDFLNALKDSSDQGDWHDYLSDEWASKAKTEEFLSEMGEQPAAIADTVKDVTAEIDPFTYYDQTRTTSKLSKGRGIGVQRGGRGAHDVAVEVWNSGIDIAWSNDSPDFDRIPEAVRKMFLDSVNLAAFHLRNTSMAGDSDALKALAFKIAKGQITYGYSVEHGLVPQKREGAMMPSASNERASAQMVVQNDFFKDNAEEFNDGPYGFNVVESKKDKRYLLGQGELVMVDSGNGVPTPHHMAAGTEYASTFEELTIHPGMREMYVEIDPVADGFTHGYLKPGEDGQAIDVGNGFQYVYDGEQSSWTMRWKYVPDADAVGIDEVAAMAIDPEPRGPGNPRGIRRKAADRITRAYLDQELKNGRITEREYNEVIESRIVPVEQALDKVAGDQHPETLDDQYIKDVDDAVAAGKASAFARTSNRPVNEREDLISYSGNFITGLERMKPVAYDDATGQTITADNPVTKGGHPTVGHGFNLDRADAKEKIEAMGYNYEKVKKGEQVINETDALALRDAVIQEEMNWLLPKLTKHNIIPSELSDNQFAALLSMIYHGRGRLTSDMMHALEKKDYRKMVDLILNTRIPSKVVPYPEAGFKLRKSKEATMFHQGHAEPPKATARPLRDFPIPKRRPTQ